MATEGTPIPPASSDKAAAQPPAMPGPVALLAATALGSFLGSRVGARPLAVAAGATALAWLNLKRKAAGGPPAAPAPAPAQASASLPVAAPVPVPEQAPMSVLAPREPEVDPRVQEWLARQIDREKRAEAAAEQAAPDIGAEAWIAEITESKPAFPAPELPLPEVEPALWDEVIPAPQPPAAAAEPDEDEDYRPEPLVPDTPADHAWEAESYAVLTEPAAAPATKPLIAPILQPAPPLAMLEAPPATLFSPPAPSSALLQAPPEATAPPPASPPPGSAFAESQTTAVPAPPTGMFQAAPLVAETALGTPPPMASSPLPSPAFPEPALLREPPKPVFPTFKGAASFPPPPPVLAANTTPIPGIEPLPSWNEAGESASMASDLGMDVDLEALFNMPAYQGGVLPNEIAVPQPPDEEAVFASSPPVPSVPEPDLDPMAAFFQTPPPAAPSEEAGAKPTSPPEIAVHVAAAGEAWFDSPLADVPNPWLPPQVEDEGFAPASFPPPTPPPPAAPAPPSPPAPVVEAEIVLRPRAPVQAAVVSKSMPPAKPPVIDQETEAASAEDAPPPAPVQSPREQRARSSWRSWWRGD